MGLSGRQWRNLLKDIQQQRCILLLGPKLAVQESGGEFKPLLELLSKHLSEELREESIAFEPKSSSNLSYIAQRFMSIPKIRRMDLEDEVLLFYKTYTRQIPDIYRTLAQLPFHLVVNTTPDDYMYKAFKAAKKWESQFLHYNFRKEKGQIIPAFSIEAPLVYNLLGSLSDPESLVINEEDQVEFIKNVVKGNPSIPNQIMRHFDERKTYLFLGFDLEKWHFRLLLDSLKLDTDNMTISPQLDNYPLSSVTQAFYEDRYRFVFVEERIADFLNNLSGEFKGVEQNSQENSVKNIVILHDNNEQDTQCRNKLADHLSVLESTRNLNIWHIGKSEYGHVEEQLREKINKADLILPILSADFFASDQIDQREMKILLQRENTKPVQILNILFRACNYEDSKLSGFKVLPSPSQPIQSFPNEDEAYKMIVEQLKAVMDEQGA